MRNFDRRPWTISDIVIRLVLVILAALLLLALQVTGYLQPFKGQITSATSPIQLVSTGVTETVTDIFTLISEFGTLRQRVSELEEQNAALNNELADKRELERENRELRELFSFSDLRPALKLRGAQIVARVIGQESTNFLRYITIDLGTRQGVAVGMPVVTPRGLVGRISEARESTSDVLLIQNVNSYVSVILQNSRLPGVLNGRPNGDLVMDFIAQGAQFTRGELVLTSGLGGSFPPGIIVGVVTQRQQNDINVLQQASIEPAVVTDQLELVAVVTNFDPNEVLPESLAPAPQQEQSPVETTGEQGASEATQDATQAGEEQP